MARLKNKEFKVNKLSLDGAKLGEIDHSKIYITQGEEGIARLIKEVDIDEEGTIYINIK